MNTIWQISPLNQARRAEALNTINQKTKPLGALGQLEEIALQMALIQNTPRISIANSVMMVFAADHGIADEGVSIAPSAVTRQMVLNFLAGGAAINCFCRVNNIPLKIIDAGIKYEITPAPENLISQRIAAGTSNFVYQPAMSLALANEALTRGAQLADQEIDGGADILAFGEMGIGNSSSAAAILAAVSRAPVEECAGFGTGITAEQLKKKVALIKQAISRFASDDPVVILAEVGGFEIAQICGAMLATARAKKIILVDGFIVSAAALLATRIQPNAREYMIFAHQSEETGHQLMLRLLNAKPLLHLGLRLGEGTGAALAIPLLRAAENFYNNMATFESAGITV